MERINIDTLPETNVDWYADGERANAVVLNRPIKQVAGIVNTLIDTVNDFTDAESVKIANIAKQGAASWSADVVPYPSRAQVYHNSKQWLALRANSVEPAEGADWTELATTAFVQKSLGNFAGKEEYTAAVTLSVADVGKFINLSGVSDFTVTLPARSPSIPQGSVFFLHSDSSQVYTVQRSSTDLIIVGGTQQTSVTIKHGETLVLVADDLGMWRTSGSAVLKYESQFATSLGANGYQKLPSGLIIQWGESDGHLFNTVGTKSRVITFPVSFPTSCLQVYATPGGTETPLSSGVVATFWGSGSFGIAFQNTRTDQGVSARWLAIGY